jgi:hypothetical protein
MKPAAEASATDCRKLLRETPEDITHRLMKRRFRSDWEIVYPGGGSQRQTHVRD